MNAPASFQEAFLRPGRAAHPFVDVGAPGRMVTLHSYRAAAFTSDRPVVIVQHGMKRNGDEYRDFWIPAADRHGLLIVAPTFADADWPSAASYNNGMVLDGEGRARPRANWAYHLPARLFALLRLTGITRRHRAYLYGHSAGGQFVHRLLSTTGGAAFQEVVAGNPGWYSLPTLDQPFPGGLGGLGLGPADLARLLTYPLTILAGDRDIATDDPNLPGDPQALAQGPHRFARAHNYLSAGRAAAADLGVACAWRLVVVPGVGHDGAAMGVAAAGLWFEGRLPAAIDAGFQA
jgi:poly(3-hydroxybutyrate) depolymerase